MIFLIIIIRYFSLQQAKRIQTLSRSSSKNSLGSPHVCMRKTPSITSHGFFFNLSQNNFIIMKSYQPIKDEMKAIRR